MRRLPKLALLLLLSSCFEDPAGNDNPGSTGSDTSSSDTGDSTGTAESTGSDESTTSGDDTSSTETGTPPDLPGVEPWDPCATEQDCDEAAPLCVVDDYGRGVCTRACESNLQCPQPTTGDADAVCTPSKVCLLNCSGELVCPDEMFCTNTHYNNGFTGGLCLWELEPEACAEVDQSCTKTADCCDGQCVGFKCE
jgi:hypothetical protein